MKDYQSLPDEEAEAAIYAELQAYDKRERTGRVAIGLMAKAVRERLLWRHRADPETDLPCRSWTRYLKCACPYAYSTVHSALDDVEALADVPADVLAQIPAVNLSTLRQLSTAVRADAVVLAAAKSQGSDAFVETIRKTHPGQHLEHNKVLRFKPSESAALIIEAVLEESLEHGANTKEDALEMWAVMARQQWQMEREVEDAHTKGSVSR